MASDVKGTSQEFYLHSEHDDRSTNFNISIRPSFKDRELALYAKNAVQDEIFELHNDYRPGTGWHEYELLWRQGNI